MRLESRCQGGLSNRMGNAVVKECDSFRKSSENCTAGKEVMGEREEKEVQTVKSKTGSRK